MIPRGVMTLTIKEAYVDSEDTPCIVLSGASEVGPITVALRGKGLDLEGTTIGAEVKVALTGPFPWPRHWTAPEEADAGQPSPR